MKICKNGLVNVAAAIIIDMAKTYVNARYMVITNPSPETNEHLEKIRQEILTTPWNFTRLTNEELLTKIERDGIEIIKRDIADISAEVA